jgi:hypothetical protein
MKIKDIYLIAFSIFLVFSIASCSDSTTKVQKTNLQLILVDSPGDYEEVNIDLIDILINKTENEEDGWVSIENVNTGIYNLIELTGGVEAMLVDMDLPAGYVHQIRLLLGEDNSIKLKDNPDLIPLKTPSAQQSGLKLKLKTELLSGITYRFVLDWDAHKSIIKAGNSGNYNLKPVIRVATEAVSGAISGSIIPDSIPTMVKAYIPLQTDTLTTLSNQGDFFIHGVSEGIYDLLFIPDTLSIYKNTTLTNIEVVTGNITEVGSIILDQK